MTSCLFPVVGAASEARAGGGGPTGAAGGAAQRAGGEGKAGAHNHPAQAADGPVWHGGRQPLSSPHPFHRTPQCPLATLLLLFLFLGGPGGWPKVTATPGGASSSPPCPLSFLSQPPDSPTETNKSAESRKDLHIFSGCFVLGFFKLCISPSSFLSVGLTVFVIYHHLTQPFYVVFSFFLSNFPLL